MTSDDRQRTLEQLLDDVVEARDLARKLVDDTPRASPAYSVLQIVEHNLQTEVTRVRRLVGGCVR